MKKRNAVLRAQQVVSGIIVAVFAVGLFQTIHLLHAMSAFNGESLFYSWYVLMQVVPLVVFAALWLVTRGSAWERAYQALVLSTAAVFVGSAFATFCFSFMMRPLYQYVTVTNASQSYIYDFITILLPQLIFAVIFALLLLRQKSVKRALSLSYAALAYAAVAYFAISLLDTIDQVVQQYPSNPNLSAYVTSFVWLFGVVLLAGALVFLERNRGNKKPFRAASFITTFGVVALYNVMSLISLMHIEWTVQWLAAFCIMLGCVGALFGFRWLYRTLRVLD